ncbi:polyprotein [Minatitlan virus]|uniref:Envelopment polyprotein n=1 Tax=Minatitlan virus TaxID=35315 RepID=A0A7D9MVK2_9VIRU|nr:polyprotein [Minatitlan virus]QLA46926.1 polyprotein [Minatitlan virus]
MLSFLLIVASLKSMGGVPIDGRCFSDGVVAADRHMDHGIAEICIKDDISMVKTTSKQFANTTKYANVVLRKMLVQNYEECNPVEVANGPIMIFKPNEDLMLIPHTYACRVECTISLNEEDATIILHSDKLNHYEVMGTTTANRWFQGSTTYSLEHTCEHIQVTCGSNSLGFHACFKYHMACIRLMNRSYMPAFMIQSVCQNKELIIVGALILIIFGLLYILTLTYICYILIPVFYPITYIYGVIYNKSCKKCYYCGLAYHPFSKCGKNCVCGCMFENSERMKKHRESGMCKGYKSLRAARILCKNRGSSFVLAVILSFLLLSFIQPIEGIKLSYQGEIIEIETVTEEFDLVLSKLAEARSLPMAYCVLTAIFSLILAITMVFKSSIESKIMRLYAHYCGECDMIHQRRGLRYFFNGEFTNKCNSCMCGCNYNAEFNNDESDYMIPMDHILKPECSIPGKYQALRRMSRTTDNIILGFLLLLFCLSVSYAEDQCAKIVGSTITDSIECSVWYRLPTSCSEDTNIQQYFKSAKLPEVDVLEVEKLSTKLSNLLAESEASIFPIKSHLLESGALKMFCKELADCKKKTGKVNSELVSRLKSSKIEICAANKDTKICPCFKGEDSCSPSDSMTNAINHYKTHKEIFKDDLYKIIALMVKSYPGILAKELNIALRGKNFTKIKEIAKKMSGKFGEASAATACMNFIEKTLSDTTLANVDTKDIPVVVQSLAIPTVKPFSPTKNIVFVSMVSSTEPIKICKSAKLYRCVHLFAAVIEYYVTCGSDTTKFYKIPDSGISYNMNNRVDLCVADPFCEVNFEVVSDSKKDELSSMSCVQQTSGLQNHTKTWARTKCKKISSQTCLHKGANKTFIECQDGYFYEYHDVVYQSGTDEIGTYCFDRNCKKYSYPHHPVNLVGCILHVNNMNNRKLREIVYEDIEQLKHSIQEAIKTDLVQHKYKLTKDLPKIAPSFKPLSIQGIESDSGIDNAYIETNIIARTGMSTGITLKAKDGKTLFDLIIFIKSAHYESSASLIYTTGPTVGITMQHEEQCTGRCPEKISKKGWLSFSKEHTSQWGCEEFGCLAINEGCLYGNCRDIIRPELQVYKKTLNDDPKIEICIALPEGSYCHELTSFNPVVTDKLEIQFLSNEAGRIPRIFGYKSNKVLTGMINDKGTFSRMCGSVQSFDNQIWGSGTAKFDYICHAARRKEVTISRCYDNFYEACLNLNQERDMVFDDKTNKILSLNKLLGEIRVKVKLGDIRYKVFEKEPSMDVKLSCAGCLNCIKGMDCELNIISSSDTVCPLVSNCQLFHNNIKIEANTQKYGIKAKCAENKVTITVCNIQVEAQAMVVDKHETIEVGNSDQTYFVKEKDIRCGTWLCKVADQGISSILSPFFSIFGTYGKIAFYTVLGVLVAALLIYLLLPMCGRLKDLLQKNDIEYHRENFGYKSLPYRR